MRTIKTLLIVSILSISGYLSAGNVQAFFSMCQFQAPEKGPFIETYLSVYGKSVEYTKLPNGKFQGAIEVGIKITKKDQQAYADKYNLLSPVVEDTSKLNFNFLDQQRIPLPNGEYELTLSISDRNHKDTPYSSKQKFTINFVDTDVLVSDIELLDSYKKSTDSNALTKSGFDLVPLVINYFPPNANTMRFYAEIYHTKNILKGENYLVSYYIQQAKTKRILGEYSRFVKTTPEEVNIVLDEFDISKLSSGNYSLIIEVRTKKNDLIAYKDFFFQRNSGVAASPVSQEDFNKIDISTAFVKNFTVRDSLIDYVRCLRPISGPSEADFIERELKVADQLMLQQYLYNFWLKRNANDPESSWLTYRKAVWVVNEHYSTKVTKGYDSDRGRVYLAYGPPNSESENLTEPSAYPYVIWQYYTLKNQSNRKFVFYNPDLVSNDFLLLHSDATGEVNNPQWEAMIHKRDTQSRDLDFGTAPEHFGGKVDDNYKVPH